MRVYRAIGNRYREAIEWARGPWRQHKRNAITDGQDFYQRNYASVHLQRANIDPQGNITDIRIYREISPKERVPL